MLFYTFAILVNFFPFSTSAVSATIEERYNAYMLKGLLPGIDDETFFYLDCSDEYIYKPEIQMLEQFYPNLEEVSITYKNKTITADKIYWELSINKTFTLKKAPIYFIKEISNYGVLGLGPNSDKNPESLISLMYDEGLIKEKKFTFFKDRVIFGGVKVKEARTYVDIPAITSEGSWGFNLRGIRFAESGKEYDSFQNNKYAFFDSINDRIFAPLEFIDFLVNTDNPMSRLIQQKLCIYIEDTRSKFFHCKKGVLNKFPAIVFDIDGVEFSMSGNETIVDIYSDKYELFIIQYNYVNSEKDKWLFGSYFFRKYIIQFDFEKKGFRIYADNVNTRKKKVCRAYFYCLNIVTICVGIALLVASKFK